MRLPTRRLSRLRPPTSQRLLGEPDGEASPIAKRRVIVPPVGHPMPLPGNMTASLGMMFERHDKAPGWNRLSSIPFSTQREVRHVRATNPPPAMNLAAECFVIWLTASLTSRAL